MTECPCCYRLSVGEDRICTRCKVAVPVLVAPATVAHRWFGHGPDRDFVSAGIDYTRTKEDKQ